MGLKDYEIERFEHAGRTVVIYYDTDAPDPRGWDNLAVLACWHRRENLGDRQIPAPLCAAGMLGKTPNRSEM